MRFFAPALLLALLACKQGPEPSRTQPPAGEPAAAADRPAQPPALTAPEAERGRQACSAYVAQVCACAEKDENLRSECEMARARPQALDMSLRAAMAEGNATEKDRRAIQSNAEQIARACIEDASALVKRGCAPPRPGSGPVPAPPPEPEPLQPAPDQTR